MKEIIIVLGAAMAVIAFAFVGLGIKILVKKNGEFKRHCSSVDPYTGERSGCVCGKTILDKCKTSPQYHPLEVNKELLDEVNGK
ncbi:MAG: hypothetical protein MJZ62_04590 [Bacteroidales bacterium]|nr:hypothetical protein [Bacteroidales bacterium]